MNTSDSVIDEIRERRRHMSKRCGHDPKKYIEYLKNFNRKYSVQIEKYLKTRQEFSGEITVS